MTKTKKASITALAASAALFISGFVCTGFTFEKNASADTGCTHAYEVTEVAATCTEQGYTLYTCTDCGDTKKDNYTEASGHDYTRKCRAYMLP